METMQLKTPVGKLTIKTEENTIVALEIGQGSTAAVPAKLNAFQREIKSQIQNYFRQQHAGFNLPLQPHGTEFQQRVWKLLCKIPHGQVMTYGAVAKKLASSPRAVGNACRANPIALLIPCHRVVGQQGIGGYAGKTAGKQITLKRRLLNHEGALA